MRVPGSEIMLELRDLCKWFPMRYGVADALRMKRRNYLKAVNDVSLTIYRGENVGLVGESGCGKSTLAKTILRLYEPTSGSILLGGDDISILTGKALRQKRTRMQMIFQDPYSSLNPRMSVYDTLAEELLVHNIVPKDQVRSRVAQLLEMCGLSMDIADRYPGEFSGGQRQRVCIARSLALESSFIVADEPVSALDVSIQAQIINLIAKLQKSLNLTVLFISHDLRLVRYITNRVMVMYLGSTVELGDTQAIFDSPLHPYTHVLTQAAPELDPRKRNATSAIEGELPSPINAPPGCKFHPRCIHCQTRCEHEEPRLREVTPERFVACHFPLKI
ncbi:ABC transporter ATP-binding protein [Clostridia bacterium]|nr:ABC transporter ATP-binding protein [Clostridia bacterium]